MRVKNILKGLDQKAKDYFFLTLAELKQSCVNERIAIEQSRSFLKDYLKKRKENEG